MLLLPPSLSLLFFLQVPARWLSSYCSAACDVMPGMSSQQLTMCLWGLACAEAEPHKAFVLLWFLTTMGSMRRAATQVCMCADVCVCVVVVAG